jgi:hypothetical protein
MVAVAPLRIRIGSVDDGLTVYDRIAADQRRTLERSLVQALEAEELAVDDVEVILLTNDRDLAEWRELFVRALREFLQ